MAHTSGTVKLLLNQIDVATRFGIVVEIPSRHPTTLWQAFLSSWSSWAGFPKAFLVDGGGEFERECRTEAQQDGVAQRSGGAWKAVMRALADERNVDFNDPARLSWAVSSVNWALNSRVTSSGYSASRWVLARPLARSPLTT